VSKTRLLQIPVRVTPEAEELLLRIKQGGDSAVLFTQGPVDVQLRKVAQLLIAGQFDAIAITKKKSRDGYLRLIQRLGVADTNIVVVGNNLETDIVPATELKLDTIFFNTPNSWSVLNRVDTGSLSYREVRRLREIWTESTETKVALG
jgi:FMN phosphatase YigB (HAD superfamily)